MILFPYFSTRASPARLCDLSDQHRIPNTILPENCIPLRPIANNYSKYDESLSYTIMTSVTN